MKTKLTYFLLALLTVTTLFSSCSKNDDFENYDNFDAIEQFEKEKSIIKEYANKNYPNMQLSSDTTGIWYEIIEEGDAESYTYIVVDSTVNGYTGKYLRIPTVTVKYTGKLISNDKIFDSNQTDAGMTGKISSYIPSWYYSFIPKSVQQFSLNGLTAKGLKKGSKIRIISPSYYTYGNNTVGTIPPNSPLFFEIEVLNIK